MSAKKVHEPAHSDLHTTGLNLKGREISCDPMLFEYRGVGGQNTFESDMFYWIESGSGFTAILTGERERERNREREREKER